MKGAWNQPFFSLQSKFRLISTLVMYYLNFYIKFDDVIQSVFWLFQKLNLLISANQFMTSEIIPLSFVLLNLKRVEGKGKHYKKSNISKRKYNLFRSNKKHFSYFMKGYHLVKKKKIVDTNIRGYLH